MSHFYGYLYGQREKAVTRCGSKKSGIKAHIRSWEEGRRMKHGKNHITVLEMIQGLDGKTYQQKYCQTCSKYITELKKVIL